MELSSLMPSFRGLPGCLGLFVLLLPGGATGATGPGVAPTHDCGVRALFLLLHLEGDPVGLDQLERALPERSPEGYSMAELAAAAQPLGRNLIGIRFTRGDRAPDRPAIVYLKDDKGGHFAVLRPVGTTGTMVQVIDPPFAPRIWDYDRIMSTKSWTGRLLVTRDPWYSRHRAPGLLAAAGFIMLAAGWFGTRRRKA